MEKQPIKTKNLYKATFCQILLTYLGILKLSLSHNYVTIVTLDLIKIMFQFKIEIVRLFQNL